jgi:hypothetical protein
MRTWLSFRTPIRGVRIGIILGANDLRKALSGPWWLRLPLQMVGGAVCGVLALAAFTLFYFIVAG